MKKIMNITTCAEDTGRYTDRARSSGRFSVATAWTGSRSCRRGSLLRR